MNGAWFVHDQLEFAGWQVQVADAQKVKGLAPLACKTDRIDAWVLPRAVPPRPGPEIWLPTPGVRAERDGPGSGCTFTATRPRSRTGCTPPCWRSASRVASDLFGAGGRRLLDRLAVPAPWAGTLAAHGAAHRRPGPAGCRLRAGAAPLGPRPPYVPLLMTAPGIAWVLGYTIAAEVGDIGRFPSPKKRCGSTGLCPRVDQSGDRDHRGPLANNGPNYLRWTLIEAATHAARHPATATTTRRPGVGWARSAAQGRPGRCRPQARRASWYLLTRHNHSCRQGPSQRRWSLEDPNLRWASRTLPPDLLLHPGGDTKLSTHSTPPGVRSARHLIP